MNNTVQDKTRVIEGTVVSDKMDKTAVVSIDRIKTHRLYKKKYTISNKIKAHDPNNEYHVGDLVEIEATRPISRQKQYQIVRKVK